MAELGMWGPGTVHQLGAARKPGCAQKSLGPALSAYSFDLFLLQLQLFYKELNLNQKQETYISKENDGNGILYIVTETWDFHFGVELFISLQKSHCILSTD